MIKKYDEYYFQKIDNVGIMYASITTYKNPNTYRISVKLKEKISEAELKEAVIKTLEIIPAFNVKLKRGLFWYYLEKNNLEPVVEQDNTYPCVRIDTYKNNNFLFKITYFEKRINIDVSHILSDGTGAINFLETLIKNYLTIKKEINGQKETFAEMLSKNEMSSDSFKRYCEFIEKKDDKKLEFAYKLKGIRLYENELNVIIGTVSVEELKKKAKEYNVNITSFILAIYVYSIYNENYKYHRQNKPITICIPVNLRNYFESTSMNNFFIPVNIKVDFYKKIYTFEELIKIVDEEVKKEIEKENLARKFKSTVAYEVNLFARAVPLFIKNFIIKIGFLIGDSVVSATLSNLGNIKVSEEIRPYIDKYDVMIYCNNSQPMKIALVSFEDKMSLAFSSCLTDVEIQKSFFTFLTKLGINVTITSNGEE